MKTIGLSKFLSSEYGRRTLYSPAQLQGRIAPVERQVPGMDFSVSLLESNILYEVCKRAADTYVP